MWLRTTEKQVRGMPSRVRQINVPSAITPTPAFLHAEIMLENCARLPLFEVRVYETGW
jgi:hypothetical protein